MEYHFIYKLLLKVYFRLKKTKLLIKIEQNQFYLFELLYRLDLKCLNAKINHPNKHKKTPEHRVYFLA